MAFCKYCGHKFEDDAVFCAGCGKKAVIKSTEESEKVLDLDDFIEDVPKNSAKESVPYGVCKCCKEEYIGSKDGLCADCRKTQFEKTKDEAETDENIVIKPPKQEEKEVKHNKKKNKLIGYGIAVLIGIIILFVSMGGFSLWGNKPPTQAELQSYAKSYCERNFTEAERFYFAYNGGVVEGDIAYIAIRAQGILQGYYVMNWKTMQGRTVNTLEEAKNFRG